MLQALFCFVLLIFKIWLTFLKEDPSEWEVLAMALSFYPAVINYQYRH